MLSHMQMDISFPPIFIRLMQGKQNKNNRKYRTKILMNRSYFFDHHNHTCWKNECKLRTLLWWNY